MIDRSSAAGFLLLLFCAGCATPPLNVEPVGTIFNEATLAYSYGTGRVFRVQSDSVMITALSPAAANQAATAEAKSRIQNAKARTKEAAAKARAGSRAARSRTTGSSSASTMDQQARRAETRQAESSASSQSADRAGFAEQRSARESHRSADAQASQESIAASSSARERFAAFRASEQIGRATMSVANFASTGRVESHQSSIRDAVAEATWAASDAQARIGWSAQRPSIHKRTTRNRVVLGERFDYVVEVLNDTGLDLAVVGLGDRLDARLCVNPLTVRTSPRRNAHVDLTNRLLKVKFPQGLKRGESATIVIPAVLISGKDDQGKDP